LNVDKKLEVRDAWLTSSSSSGPSRGVPEPPDVNPVNRGQENRWKGGEGRYALLGDDVSDEASVLMRLA